MSYFNGHRIDGASGVICRVCKRPLKSAASIAAGAGPVCRGSRNYRASSASNKTLSLPGFGADFSHIIIKGVLVITDLNLGGKSVTNDIENVLYKIKAEIGELPKDIIYRDSEGAFDYVFLINGVAQFRSLRNARTVEIALERLREVR